MLKKAGHNSIDSVLLGLAFECILSYDEHLKKWCVTFSTWSSILSYPPFSFLPNKARDFEEHNKDMLTIVLNPPILRNLTHSSLTALSYEGMNLREMKIEQMFPLEWNFKTLMGNNVSL